MTPREIAALEIMLEDYGTARVLTTLAECVERIRLSGDRRRYCHCSQCEACGETADEGINCPDGAFVCRSCFDQGAH